MNSPLRIFNHWRFCTFDPTGMGGSYKHRERFNNAVFISPKRDFMFTKNEKCANVTARKSLQHLVAGRPLPENFKDIDRWFAPLLQPSDLRLPRIDDINDIPFKFAVVRNPYSRLLSFFLNAKRENFVGKLRLHPKTDFASFVAEVTEQTPEQMNRHWKVQYYNIYCDVIRHDHFIKFENFEDEFRKVMARFGAKTKIRSAHKGQSNAGTRIADYYTPEITAKVREKYALDFESFGYSTELPA